MMKSKVIYSPIRFFDNILLFLKRHVLNVQIPSLFKVWAFSSFSANFGADFGKVFNMKVVDLGPSFPPI